MTDSIREQIVQNVQTLIRSVKKSGGYQFDIEYNQVKRDFQNVLGDMTVYPVVYLFEGSEEKVGDEGSVHHLAFDLSATICLTEADELSRYINNIEADVVKAVLSDRGQNSLAMETESLGSEPFALEGTEIGGRTVFFKITYLVNKANPYSQSL